MGQAAQMAGGPKAGFTRSCNCGRLGMHESPFAVVKSAVVLERSGYAL